MAAVIQALIGGYRYLNEEVADPRTRDLFLISSPWAGLALLAFYLYFIFDLGPKLMEKRAPFQLQRLMQVYDAIQIAACCYIVYQALTLAWLQDYKLKCTPVDYSDNPRAVQIARAVWAYFLLKTFDLLDTVFFVLRKKQNQVTFLHVYHHAGMVVASWAAVKWLPGGHVTLLGLINGIVHMAMYTHYLIVSFKIWKPWWKKHITHLQLMQFIILLYHFAQLLWVENCGFPLWPSALFIPQNLFMIVLFCDFYYKTYIKKRPQKIQPQNGVANGVTLPNGKAKDC